MVEEKKVPAMLEYCQKVLTKVSFDKLLFRKELKKAISWLKGDDRVKLRQWCIEKYGSLYNDIIAESFAPSF